MESEILIIDKNFGVITENEVVLSKKNNQKNINFDIIKKVKLIKQRIYLSNLLLIILSVNLLIIAYKLFTYNYIISIGLIAIGIYCLIMSIYHKYYKYKLVIIENDNAIHKIETKQSNRDSIKDFYYTIANKISKKKSNLN
jgi:hypothetical protein